MYNRSNQQAGTTGPGMGGGRGALRSALGGANSADVSGRQEMSRYSGPDARPPNQDVSNGRQALRQMVPQGPALPQPPSIRPPGGAPAPSPFSPNWQPPNKSMPPNVMPGQPGINPPAGPTPRMAYPMPANPGVPRGPAPPPQAGQERLRTAMTGLQANQAPSTMAPAMSGMDRIRSMYRGGW